LTLQLTFPLITSLGFDPIWFGVLSMMMVAMGLVFAVADRLRGQRHANVDLMKVYKGTSILDAGDRYHHGAADDLSADRAVVAADDEVTVCRPLSLSLLRVGLC